MAEKKNPEREHDDDPPAVTPESHPPDGDDDDPPMVTPESTLAADDPTAVWDADALRDAGLEDLVDRPEGQEAPPATRAERDASPSIITQTIPETEGDVDADFETEADAAPAAEPRPVPLQRGPSHRPVTRESPAHKEMGWGTTIALATALGAVVYFAIRFLR